MSDGMGREFTYLSSHATNRYFIPNWGIFIHHFAYLCKTIIVLYKYALSGFYIILHNKV